MEALDRMVSAEEKRRELLHEIHCSVNLQKIFPDCFEHGRVKTRVVGNGHEPWDIMFIVERGDGSIRQAPASDVPKYLWEESFEKFAATPRLGAKAARWYQKMRVSLQ